MSTIYTSTEVQINYPSLFEAKQFTNGGAKFGAMLLINKNDKESLDVINTAIEEAIKSGNLLDNGNLRLPLRDGDIEHPGELAFNNKYYLNAYSAHQPTVVDRDALPITNKREFSPGTFVKVAIRFYSYSHSQQGVAAEILGVQQVAEGTLESQQPKEEISFSAIQEDDEFVEIDEDDFLN
ncbi:MAG: DUF2815 family protein [Clostridia bacterium]